VVNGNHPLIAKLNEEKDETHKKDLAKQLVDLAKLSQNLLKGEELTGFIKRSINIIQ
jgi:molecular chaperone HtpG